MTNKIPDPDFLDIEDPKNMCSRLNEHCAEEEDSCLQCWLAHPGTGLCPYLACDTEKWDSKKK
jgi:hypothetical protein